MKREGKCEMTYNLIRDEYSICQVNQILISTNIETAVLSRQDQNMNMSRIVLKREWKYEMTYNLIRKVEREDILWWGSRSKNKDQVPQ